MHARTLILLGLAAGLLVVAAFLGGPSSPSCVPVDPVEPVCEAAADCWWCEYRTAPASPAECECAFCYDATPMSADVCLRNREAYDRHCGHLDCPLVLCQEFPPVTCSGGDCVVSPAGCGDQDVIGRYAACTAARDEATCRAHGGAWEIVGLSPEPSCQCRTGQGDCPCNGPDDCLSSCIAPMGPDMWDCAGAVGHCSPVSLTVGCHCFFWQDGQPQGLCAD